MITSSSIAKIAPAILAAQRKIGGAVKDSTNPHFRAGFASLGSVIQAVKFALNEEGISVLQPIGRDEHGDYVETFLIHESGEFVSEKTKMVCAKQNDPQAAGSSHTYFRRYSLQSLMLIPTTDDDGEAAMFRQGDNQAQDDRPSWEEPTKPGSTDFRNVAIHFGKNVHKTLAELSPQTVLWYLETWLPSKENDPRTSADDRKLVQALKDYAKWQKENK